VAKPTSGAPGEIHAEEDDRAAQDLADAKPLAEEADPRDDPGEGYEVLVDQHPISPDAADTPLLGRKGEGHREDRREPHRGPGPAFHLSPVEVYQAALIHRSV
jgi:hypothetical protein